MFRTKICAIILYLHPFSRQFSVFYYLTWTVGCRSVNHVDGEKHKVKKVEEEQR